MAEKKKDKAPSTGLKKFYGQEAKKYEPPVKGSGKEKYQNVIKSERLDTKASSKASLKTIKELVGKKVTKQELNRKAGKKPNVAKQIDREEKVRKGVRTEKPSTPKVPVKPRGGRGGGMGGGVSIGKVR
jgi:hypothetical protein